MRLLKLPLLVLFAVSGWPQTSAPKDRPEIASQEAPFTFSSRVNLVSVPVVVRGRDGRAVGNLQKEDFQLLDKGKAQLITKFTVERADAAGIEAASSQKETEKQGAAPQPVLPDRYVAYLADDVHLLSGDLLQTRQAMNRHLDESLEPSARAAVFTTSGQVLSDFTADREKLHRAVNSVQPYTSGIDRQQDCPSVSYYVADLLVNKLLYLDGHLFNDGQLVQMINNGQADQTLVSVYGEAFNYCTPCTPGKVDTLSGVDVCQIQALNTARTAVRRALTFGDHETASALAALRDVIRKLSAMPGNRNLVLVSPGFLLTRDHRSDEYDLLDRAIRANVIVNTIDMRGLFTTIPGGTADQHSRNLDTARYDRDAAIEADDVLEEFADGTGGAFFHNDNGLKEGLNRLAARPEYIYVLGFSPDNLKYDGSYHGLKVTLKNSPGLTVQARRGYWAPRHEVDSAEAAREVIRDTVFSREEVSGIPVDLETEFFKASDSKSELTVTARLHPRDLGFRKAEERNNDTLTVVAGVFDSNGNYISGIERVLEMHLRDETFAALETSGIAVKESFNLAPGRYIVRLVVRDAGGDTMAARNAGVEIP
jgi:VWFA-related protein